MVLFLILWKDLFKNKYKKLTYWLRNGYLTVPSTLHDSIFGRKHGAGEGIRTLDFNLGKVAITKIKVPFLSESITFIDA